MVSIFLISFKITFRLHQHQGVNFRDIFLIFWNFRFWRMSQLLINGQSIQQYFQQHGNGNLLLQRAPQQIAPTMNPQFIITRPVVQNQNPQNQPQPSPQIQQIPPQIFPEDVKNIQLTRKMMWLLVELESNNEGNVYAVVEAKDVVGNLDFNNLHTGKIIIVNYNQKQRRASIVMASGEFSIQIHQKSLKLN